MLYGDLPELIVDGQTVRGVTVKIPNPPKSAVLRLPTAAEILERIDQGKTRADRASRRRTSNGLDLKPDLWLFNKVRLDKGEEFDEFEAATSINTITACEALSCEHTDTGFEVVLKTPFGETTHILCSPTQKALVEFRRGSGGSMDQLISFFDSMSKKFVGYSEKYSLADIPANHKSTVVREIVADASDLDPVIDPNS